MSLILTDFVEKVKETDFNQLPISDYNKKYIASQKSSIYYYTNIYNYVRQFLLKISAPQKEEDLILVDYGGGCGFFSILMKMFGIHKVIYVDRNPLSVQTVEELSKVFGTGPDAIICGDSPELVAWCRENQVKPHAVVGIDVIEHIYNLRHFFADISSLNNDLRLLFTTASNPYNSWKCRKLQKLMDSYEKGDAITPNYYTKRLQFIQRTYPKMPEEKAHEYAAITRGMNYEDIRYFIRSHNYKGTGAATFSGYIDKHNTCDPETGNYVERILPLIEYCEHMLDPQDNHLIFHFGFYNYQSGNILKNICARIANWLIKHNRIFGFKFSPFILIGSIRNRTDQ